MGTAATAGTDKGKLRELHEQIRGSCNITEQQQRSLPELLESESFSPHFLLFRFSQRPLNMLFEARDQNRRECQ
jgi:hypothetical protein